MKNTSHAQLSVAFLLSVLELAGVGAALAQPQQPTAVPASLIPVVELEEAVYTFEPANNGAGPMWCSGSTCLVRVSI